MTAVTCSPYCSASLALLLLVMPAANGWVMHNFRDAASSSNRACIVNNDEKYFCPAIPSTTTSRLLATTVEDDEVIEYLDDDDEDDDDDSNANYDPEDALAKQAEWMSELRRLSRTASSDPSAVIDAQEIFDEMFTAYVESDDATFFPTVEVYNLMIETHAYSRSDDGGDEAERILGRMEDASNDFAAKPNEDTYLCVMDAWAMRKQPDKAKEVLDRQEEPSTDAYNKLIKAYGIADDFKTAESTFRSLLSEGKANHKSWVQLLKARASCKTADFKTVESYFDEMEEAEFKPETDAFNVLIRSFGKFEDGPKKAEAMLFEMIERFRGGEENVKPNAGTFRAVLYAYNNKGKKDKMLDSASSAAKVEQLMQFREGLVSPEDHGYADETTYTNALEIISRCRDSKKAIRANRILQKYNGAESPVLKYLVLQACASTEGNSEEKFAAFQVALGILKELRSSSEHGIDSSTTGMFIKSCSKLMPVGSKRDEIVKKVFRECCEQGLVNDYVLNQFELATSEGVQLEILGGFSVDGASIPDSWSRSVVD
jgi:pentatricopeptide repeat protein